MPNHERTQQLVHKYRRQTRSRRRGQRLSEGRDFGKTDIDEEEFVNRVQRAIGEMEAVEEWGTPYAKPNGIGTEIYIRRKGRDFRIDADVTGGRPALALYDPKSGKGVAEDIPHGDTVRDIKASISQLFSRARTKGVIDESRQHNRSMRLDEAVSFRDMREKMGWLIEKVRDDLRNEYGEQYKQIANDLNEARRMFGEALGGWDRLGPDEGHKLVGPLRRVVGKLKTIERDIKSSGLENHWARWVSEPRRYIADLADVIENDSAEGMRELEKNLTQRAYYESLDPSGGQITEAIDNRVLKEMLRTFREEIDGFRPQDATAEFGTGFYRLMATLQVTGEVTDQATAEESLERLTRKFSNEPIRSHVGRGMIEISWSLIPTF